ncbi:methylenetetrahydrofolate reductase [Nodosilinea nodulosa]|uniref:methylenetetrahydrofolate reductase n=1 Tax=Nodosilinea nodulosa TaxID=416001 RepID=UPI0002DE177B|nr:methylenetetrahydrofolate reductase [Nodosilinea nodulosa]
MQFSIEVTPKVDVSELPQSVREVSITYLPGADDREVVVQAARLKALGYDPIPHVPARSMRDRTHLSDYLAALRDQAQIRQVLIIGGSPDRPVGPFSSTLDLLETGLFDGLRIGVAGHPEGMPMLDEPASDRILALKNQYARETGTDMFVMTQWSLDVATVRAWLDRIEPFNHLPIYLGIPGPTSPATLLKFAKLCGVKTSLLGLKQQSSRLGKLLTVQTPDYLVDGLSPRITHFHIYTFGGVARSRDWLTTRLSQEAIPA